MVINIKSFGIAVLCAFAASAQAQNLAERTVKKGHMVCYSRADLIAAWAAIKDENFVIPVRLLESGKCIMLERDRKFAIADFNPDDSIQAVVFPSGQWGRVATVSIR